MRQKSENTKTSQPKLVTNTYGVKMLVVKMGEKATTKKYRTSRSSNKLDEQDVVLDAIPLHMVFPVDVSKDKS